MSAGATSSKAKRAARSPRANRRATSRSRGSTTARCHGSTCTSAPAGDGTTLRLEHIAHVDDKKWDEYGPGAVGVGWDLTIVALAEHLETGEQVVPDLSNADALDFMRGSSDDWCRASIEAGTPAEEATAAAARTAAAYTGG